MNEATEKFLDDADGWKWEAVLTKNAEMDGVFYFAVMTTKVFCRPSCTSRTPNKQNVHYFYSIEDAMNAGFRPCRRCKPQAKIKYSPQKDIVMKALSELNDDREINSVSELVISLGISQDVLRQSFKMVLGITPRSAIEYIKMERFKLNISEMTVTDAIYESGFGSSRAVYEKAVDKIGMTPAKYKKGGHGITINYAIFETPVGKMLIAVTEKGICAAAFGDNEKDLSEQLSREFFAAEIVEDHEKLAKAITAVKESFIGVNKIADLPLDIRGTGFQLRVWAELRKIRFGETSTYGEIAERLGNPKAYRAVARACATNTVALITPCHRVIASNGKLSGYKWGIAKKAKLLAVERQISEDRS